MANDRKIARASLREEKKAVRDYGKRISRAASPGLKSALRHAKGEEQKHAASLRPFAEGAMRGYKGKKPMMKPEKGETMKHERGESAKKERAEHKKGRKK